jgi:hypothetical protein
MEKERRPARALGARRTPEMTWLIIIVDDFTS